MTIYKSLLVYFNTGRQNAVPMGVIVPEEHITSESFVVQWDRVSIYNGNYIVRWYGEDGSSGMDTVNGTSYTVTGLTALTSYSVTVAVYTCLGARQFSNIIMTMTNNLPPTSPPSPTTPGNVIMYMYVRLLSTIVYNRRLTRTIWLLTFSHF